jgi:hypothetical protein
LQTFVVLRSEIMQAGGWKSLMPLALTLFPIERSWAEKQFDTAITIDGVRRNAPTDRVDRYKNAVALEVERNNKTELYDRDLNNFRLLYDLRAIDAGLIVTRSSRLQRIFAELGRGNAHGASTTHIDKLLPRLEGGSGGGCPVLVLGIRERLYREDHVEAGLIATPDLGDAGGEQPGRWLVGLCSRPQVQDDPCRSAVAVSKSYREDGSGAQAAVPIRDTHLRGD